MPVQSAEGVLLCLGCADRPSKQAPPARFEKLGRKSGTRWARENSGGTGLLHRVRQGRRRKILPLLANLACARPRSRRVGMLDADVTALAARMLGCFTDGLRRLMARDPADAQTWRDNDVGSAFDAQ